MGGVHLHMVGQAPKVHLVQATGMLMISSVSQRRDDKRVGAPGASREGNGIHRRPLGRDR